jgi:hypothetical protein
MSTPQSPNTPASETAVPNEETAARCPYCDRPFRTERSRALHLGETHSEEWTDDEQAAYEAAEDSEADDLFVFHLKVIAALVGLYAGLVLAYMVVLGAG